MIQIKFAHRLSATLLCLFCLPVFAAQWASVKTPKAIIYADPEMTSPIGFIKRGQRLRVGEVARNKGRLVPTLYQGKIVYIRLADIQTSEEMALVRSASDRIKEAMNTKERESRLGLGYSGFLSTVKVEQETGDFGKSQEDESFFFSGASLKGNTREGGLRNSLEFSFDYLTGSNSDTRLTFLLMSGGYCHSFIQTDQFETSACAGLSLAPWAQLDVDPLYKVNGYGAGAGGGLDVLFRPGKKLGLQLQARYQYLKLFGFNLPDSTDEILVPEKFEPVIFGPSIAAFLTYEI